MASSINDLGYNLAENTVRDNAWPQRPLKSHDRNTRPESDIVVRAEMRVAIRNGR